jgi:hypothetical protein
MKIARLLRFKKFSAVVMVTAGFLVLAVTSQVVLWA